MSAHIIGACFLLDLSASEKIVMMAVADCANDDGVGFPGRQYLAQKTSLSTKTIDAIVKKLSGSNYLSVENRRTRKGDLTSNCYTLNVDRILVDAMAARKKNCNPVAEKTLIGREATSLGVGKPLPYPRETTSLPCLSPSLFPKSSPTPSAPATFSSSKPLSDHAWFVKWWCYAFAAMTGEQYAVTKKSAGIVKNLLDTLSMEELMLRTCAFLALPSNQRFPRGSPTLEGLAGMINQLAGRCSEETEETLFKRGLLPDYGINLKDFRPWETP